MTEERRSAEADPAADAAAAAAAAFGARGTGLVGAARRLATLAGDAAETRLSLAAIELEEQRLHLVRQFIVMAWALFFAGLALLMAAGWLVLVCPPEWRARLVGGLTVGLALLSAAAWQVVRRRAERQPPPFHYTLGELRKDLALLRGPGEPS